MTNMVQNEFNKLIDKRKRWVSVTQENEFDIEGILAGLYDDPSHFIFEFCDISSQSQGLSRLVCIISHVIFGFFDIKYQFQGLSGLVCIISNVIFGFLDI